ncbi:MAG: Tn3 family transposase [Sphingomonadales bacterium]|nr:Tn3 family transposase [Sphingomonadales bacterium]
MAQISDRVPVISSAPSGNYLRLKPLNDANDNINNATAMPIFRNYNIQRMFYTRADGQKFGARRETLKPVTRRNTSVFKKAFLAMGLIANQRPLMRVIGANEHDPTTSLRFC